MTLRTSALGLGILVSLSGSVMAVPPSVSAQSLPRGAATIDGRLDQPAQPVGTTSLVSVRPNGRAPQRKRSFDPSINGNGRYVALKSEALLVPDAGPSNGLTHTYVRDRRTGTTAAIDVRPDGKLGDNHSWDPSISAGGRLVAFSSYATDLTPGLGWRGNDVFVRDTGSQTTSIVSLAADGGPANGENQGPYLSADGSIVVFESYATNLVPGDFEVTGEYYVYRHDRSSGVTTLVSRTPTGDFPNSSSHTPSVSADGQLVAYSTSATDIVANDRGNSVCVLYDVGSDTSSLVTRAVTGEPDEGSYDCVITQDGRKVVYWSYATNLVAGDTNGCPDVFLFDIASGQTTLVSRSRSGGPANSESRFPAIDAHGSSVAFESDASNLVTGDHNDRPDVFRVDVASGVTTLISRTPSGPPPDDPSSLAAISGNGALVAYESVATLLVPGTRTRLQRVYAYRVW